MRDKSPGFAHTCSEKYTSHPNSCFGLHEPMGCDDRVMYLISETACLGSLRKDGTGDFTLHQHVAAFGKDIDSMEKGDVGPRMAFNANGSLLPKQLSQDMIITFCVAARILLYGLEPGFDPRQPTG
ncbi:hypothetical protein FOXG_14293 [Fusarium oxysporum f. sp. lycopersici 4287]|uniref:Uncharacterized protein n=2 Tax=Fusarium oxysporum TaxID=5507 RepID=A0A0J9WTG3_FUSO4|nr:hypothetical protein FOXG_14293 [Fusarium oxysporum f. sp. lycopersici 4287]EWZ78235.1 hypothetical protein FOWG_17471 [Fusarium oxysporum f. sp. lycopersici MN25]KNB15982.1 hypothetical protein FOXG_14293 [Fusarium oxysporum f. sp. lycopersici 4287]